MKSHLVKVHPEKDLLKKEEQLAWKMAQLAEHRAELDSEQSNGYQSHNNAPKIVVLFIKRDGFSSYSPGKKGKGATFLDLLNSFVQNWHSFRQSFLLCEKF